MKATIRTRNDATVAAWIFLAAVMLILFAMLAGTPGCTGAPKLDTAGPYGTNAFLFSMDKSLVDSKDVLTAFVTWEDQNHAQLITTPAGIATAKAANTIRAEAPLWFSNAYTLRTVYLNLASPGNSNSFRAAVTSIETSATESKALTK